MRTITFEQWKALSDADKAKWEIQNDGSFKEKSGTPDADLADLRRQVNEFRENNIALKKKVEELEGQAKPPEKRPEDMSLAEQLANEKRERQALQERFEAKEREVARADFRTRLAAEGKKVHLLPGAVDDLMARAEAAGFQLKDGAIVALDADGNVKPSVKVQNANLTLAEWMSDQKSNGAGHLFGSPSGAGDATGQGNGVVTKPGAKVLQDATNEQLLENLAGVADGDVILQTSQAPRI